MAPTAPTDRRRLLQLAAAGAATLWLPRGAYAQPRWASDPFTLGVASGSPRTDGMVLWTRLAPAGEAVGGAPVALRWEVAHDEQFSRIAQRGETLALPELAHTAHVEVQGLEPDRWYFYRFTSGGVASPVGRTRTLPAPDAAVSRLRLAYASCQRWEHGYFSAWEHMRAEQLDMVVFLGDYIYEYGGAANAVRPVAGGAVTTLEGYRARYALHRSDAGLRAMHAACPWLVVWDDHEVQNDYAGVHVGQGGPEVADFAARRAAAYQAFYEHMPLPAAALTRAMAGLATGAELRIHSQLRYGRLATLQMLDARQHKDALVCTPGGRAGSGYVDPSTCAAWDDPRRSMLGMAQEQWLDDALAQSGTGWNVVAQQSLFGPRDAKPGPGRLLWNDGWDGYGAARGRLLASLQKHKVPNAVFLGGDVHENWVGHVLADYARPGGEALGVEFCGTSITSRASERTRVPELLAENPHFVFADAQRRGYGVAEFTPGQMTATLRVVDDVTKPVTRVETLARFAVQAGRAKVERA